MTSFYVGDSPQWVTVVPSDDLDDLDTIAAEMHNGAAVVPLSAAIDDDGVRVDFPKDYTFTEPGLWVLRLRGQGADGARILAPHWIPVEDPAEEWYTVPSARSDWRDAPDDDARLWSLLQSAREQVLDFAPVLDEGEPVPLRYREGQLMQARNQWNASKVDPASGGLGEDSFIVRPFPLDWSIRQVLRPKTGVPEVW